MGGGVLFNLIAFHFLSNSTTKPLLNNSISSIGSVLKMGLHPDNLKIDWKLILGSTLFGIGWGLGGICPGPAIISLGALKNSATIFIPSLVAGVTINQLFSTNQTVIF